MKVAALERNYDMEQHGGNKEMTLMRMDPFRELRQWNSVFDRFFENRLSPNVREDAVVTRWSPTVDVSETPTEITFSVELPGFEKEEIEISLEENVLSISGERKFEKEENRDFHRVERWYGSFFRSFKLPATVDSSKIDAGLKDGLLTIHLPKVEEAKPRQIPVTVS